MRGCIRRTGKHSYAGADGRPVTDRQTLERLGRIRVPRSYRRACYNPDAAARLQATAYDSTGKRQYIYSRAHRDRAAREKFARVRRFGEALPAIRRDVAAMLRSPVLTNRRRGLALALVDRCRLRPGAPEYVQKNGTHGAATLRTGHVHVRGGGVQVAFRGKKRVMNRCLVNDRLVAKVAAGAGLLREDVGLASPRDLNKALPPGLFVKDIRTWGANVEFLKAALDNRHLPAHRLIRIVAAKLHNTPRVCRQHYVLPALYKWADGARGLPDPPAVRGLTANEARLLAFLKRPST